MKLGVALGGGGAKGFAHIGVLRVLESAQIPVGVVTGTSAGSIIGALYAAGKSPDEIENLMRRMSLRQWLARDRSGMGLFSTDGIRRVIETELGVDARIENLRIPFAAVAVDMDSQQEVVFENGLIADAVCASSSFPVVLAPTQFGGRCFMDGGLLNPVPFDVVRRLGADCVLGVDLAADEPTFTHRTFRNRPEELLFQFIFNAEQQKIFRVAARSISIMSKPMRAVKMIQCPPDLVIYPDVQQIGLIDFDLVDAAIAAGTNAMQDALPQLEKLIASSIENRLHHAWNELRRNRFNFGVYK